MRSVTKNKYYNWYFNIIENSKKRILDDSVKTERHHIVPKSMGGSDDDDNMSTLTLREHWICHRLLVKFLNDPVDLRKMYSALWMMLQKNYRSVTSREYQMIKESVVPWNKGMRGNYPYPNKTPEHVKEYFSKLYKGKSRSEKDIAAMKEGWKKAKENGYRPWNYGKTGIQKTVPPVTLITPTGEEKTYRTMRDACIENNLSTSIMSNVRRGHREDYNGWKVKR